MVLVPSHYSPVQKNDQWPCGIPLMVKKAFYVVFICCSICVTACVACVCGREEEGKWLLRNVW